MSFPLQITFRHMGPSLALRESVSELHPAPGFGRIETPEGRLIYFHRNSVLDHSFAKLAVGTPVRFAEEPGERGPQTSTLYVLT